ncbi:MAG: DNA (cytosine-5)-methyltransferase 1 [Marinoscillum sp.]|jgi:DNA (cytosine-5)-methyltransferase 1
MKVLDLFSGIGGFSLGLERAGMETVAFCEFDKHAQKVLKKHWPDVPVYDDVRELTNDRLKSDGITGIDVITGGFPCQDISVAGKQAGIGEGTRSGLWSEVARLIDDIQPRFAIMENVTALISGDSGRWFGRVLGDLAEIGYDAEWHCIPASELGAHHHRDRVWIITYPNSNRLQVRSDVRGINNEASGGEQQGNKNNRVYAQENATHTRCREQSQGRLYFRIRGEIKSIQENGRRQIKAEPCLGGRVNDVPGRLDRLKQLGNSVVPQIPELIGRAIMQAEA